MGKPWMHDDLIALFDFAIEKPEEEIENEKESINKGIKPYLMLALTSSLTPWINRLASCSGSLEIKPINQDTSSGSSPGLDFSKLILAPDRWNDMEQNIR